MKSFFENKLLGFFVKTNGYFSNIFFSGIGHIITLHRVLPQSSFIIPENKALEISPSYLEHLIHFYKKHNYQFASLDTLHNVLTKKEKINKKIVALTFDDGYSDVYNYAFPLLKAHEIPFNIYITAGFPENTITMWWYALEELFRDKAEVFLGFDDNIIRIKCHTIEEKQEAFKRIRDVILNNFLRYNEILNDIFKKNGLDYTEITRKISILNSLNWEQIIEMSKDPLVTIGAHSVSHPVFSKLSEESIVKEVLTSKEIIESHIDKQVNHFAYPFGGRAEVGKREFEILKRINFKTCTTTRLSNIFKGHANYMECLPRVHIGETTTDEQLNNYIKGITQYNRHKFKRIVTV